MARPIWTGTLSFGLLNIPVSLMAGERRTDISFRMLDSRNNAPIRYERVNAETGEEVAWKDIVKAFEYDKGSYVVLDEDALKSAKPQGRDAIEMEGFVERDEIGARYFDKPYVLVPAKKAEKGYVLLLQALVKTGRIGIARVVIRTREHLCAIIPEGKALLLVLMRFPQELVDIEDYAIPEKLDAKTRINDKELAFSEQLIETMSTQWQPENYRDDFRDRLHEVIRERMKSAGVVKKADDETTIAEDASTNVVDFMSLLKKSIASKQRTPASRKAPAKKAVKKAASSKPSKTAAKKSGASKAKKASSTKSSTSTARKRSA